MLYQNREIHLVSRPVGEPIETDFATVETTIDAVPDGHVVVRNDWMSVDPYMRGRMEDVESYIAPFELGKPMEGKAVGTVVESRSRQVPVGSVVLHDLGWRTYALLEESAATVVDATRVDSSAYLGVLGLTGFTAYVALTVMAPVKPGDTVFISGAAGGVGAAAGVIAKKLGAARVIGSAGGPEKNARLLDELGYDAALDYKQGHLYRQLRTAAPDGIDVYLDNVGGDHLHAAIGAMRDHGRIALCGAIAQYNATEPVPGPDNLLEAVSKRISLRGFIIFDHGDLLEKYLAVATGWLEDGSISHTFTSVDGLDRAVGAFLGLSRGSNVGKMLVRMNVG